MHQGKWCLVCLTIVCPTGKNGNKLQAGENHNVLSAIARGHNRMDGLVIYQLSADMEEVVEMENDLTYMLEDCALKLEDSPSNIY